MANKICVVVLMVALCTLACGPLELLAEPISSSAIFFSIGEVRISISYSVDEGVLKIAYSADDKECQLAFSSQARMGLLIDMVGDQEISFSLRFLEEEEIWPQAGALEKEGYTLKSRFETPGWVVIVVQRSQQGGDTE